MLWWKLFGNNTFVSAKGIIFSPFTVHGRRPTLLVYLDRLFSLQYFNRPWYNLWLLYVFKIVHYQRVNVNSFTGFYLCVFHFGSFFKFLGSNWGSEGRWVDEDDQESSSRTWDSPSDGWTRFWQAETRVLRWCTYSVRYIGALRLQPSHSDGDRA